jgi:hypothetical protein
MKLFTIIGFILMFFSIGFTSAINAQAYTYLLQVNSLSEQEQFFDLEITSKKGSESKPITMVLSDQTTPFMRILETGEHVIIIERLGGADRLLSKVTGFVNGETRGSALGDYERTILTAGPGGHYSASK